ncbi:MAG: SixA phosphatase family protein [Pseudomarimonas sp.]
MSNQLTVYLLRHAPAEAARGGQEDAQRALSARGIEEADAAAAWLVGKTKPKRAICSPALRAQQTLQRVTARTGEIETMTEPSIYEATPGQLMDVIETHRDAGSILLVGHNPGFESVVALLTTGQSGDHRGMPPAGCAVLHFSADAVIEPGAAQLTEFWSP